MHNIFVHGILYPTTYCTLYMKNIMYVYEHYEGKKEIAFKLFATAYYTCLLRSLFIFHVCIVYGHTECNKLSLLKFVQYKLFLNQQINFVLPTFFFFFFIILPPFS